MKWLKCLATAVATASIFTGGNAQSSSRNPLKYITTIEDAEILTPGHRVHAHTHFDLAFHIHDGDQRMKLKLEPNNDVIGEGASISHIGPDGEITTVEIIERSDHRVFKGSTWLQRNPGAEWTNVGWARIMVTKDGTEPVFQGAFRVDGDHHHIQTRRNYAQTKLEEDPEMPDNREDIMILWRDSDIISHDEYYGGELKKRDGEVTSCMADSLDFNNDPLHPVYNGFAEQQSFFDPMSIFKRFDDGGGSGTGAGIYLADSIGSTTGCPTTRKIALVGIATDCGYTASFDSQQLVRENIIDQMNKASQLFEDTFDISLGIQNMTISDAACPTTEQAAAKWNRACGTYDINAQLSRFSAWRGEREDNNAYWTLLTGCVGGPAVGNAWLGQVCVNTATTRNDNETSSGANVVCKVPNEWLVIAHEVGHTFGAVHDCDSQSCNDGKTVAAQQCCPLSTNSCPAGGSFVMNPSTGSNIKNFSPCSVGNICSAIGRNAVRTNCLTSNKNVPLFTGSQCGNGIVEAGEECDCGGPQGCAADSCCEPTTCKFRTGAVCDPTNDDCCTDSCQFASNSTICRASSGECDMAETCPGTSAGCPEDKTKPNGQACGAKGEGLTCASGQCTSQDAQCRTMMGIYKADTANTTYACYNTGCMALCASPELPPNTCYEMKQSYLDGTSCGGGGKCDNGVCKGSSFGGEIKNWFDTGNNKWIVIGVCAGIGALLLFSIVSCCISSCRRRRRIKNAKAAQAAAAAAGGWRPGPIGGGNYARVPTGNGGPNGGYPVPPQMMHQNSNQGWGYNGGYAPQSPRGYNNYNSYGGPPPDYAPPRAARYA